MSFPITKTYFMAGLQCQKRLWLSIRLPELATPTTTAQEQRKKQGIAISIYARQSFPEGKLVTGQLSEALEQTQKMIQAGETCLFEGAFIFDDILVYCDILRKTIAGNWEIIEVKSSTKVKEEHIPDLALQKYVLSGVGLVVEKTLIMSVNIQAENWDNITERFNLQDVSPAVNLWSLELPQALAQFRESLNQSSEPQVYIGKHCDVPYPCVFKEHCWQGVPEPSVLDIPRLQQAKLHQLLAKNILSLQDLPPNFPLTPTQKNFVEVILANQPGIDRPAIQRSLEQLKFPLHFFDVEVIASAVPLFQNLRPYEQCPFQFSCHILDAQGNLSHHSFLQEQPVDPRSPFLTALLNAIGKTGSIIVYNQSFETQILQQLALYAPESAEQLKAMISRMWDLQLIFKYAYHHPGFLGSTSLKKVLPVLVPHLSYDNLAIKKGDEAPLVWEAMLDCEKQQQKQQMLLDLKEYSALDTLAMVEIYYVLRGLGAPSLNTPKSS